MASQTQSQQPLLLEGTKPAWRVADDGLVDALPYLDKEYEDPTLRAEVNRLVQEEMRRSRKRPADFLKHLPPVPPLRPEKCPMFAREYERVRAGKPPIGGVDGSRYEAQQPSASRASDPAAWRNVAQASCCHLRHLDGKLLNLELMQEFGANAWRMHNQHLEAFLAKIQQEVSELKSNIELTNRDRKLNQQAAAAELGRLQGQWSEGVRKNMEIEAACLELEEQRARLTARAQELGIDMNTSTKIAGDGMGV